MSAPKVELVETGLFLSGETITVFDFVVAFWASVKFVSPVSFLPDLKIPATGDGADLSFTGLMLALFNLILSSMTAVLILAISWSASLARLSRAKGLFLTLRGIRGAK